MSTTSEEPHEDDVFLGQVMSHLAARSNLNMDKFMEDKRDPVEVADILHDSLVEIWDGPRRDDGVQTELLRQKADVWDRYRQSQAPRSSQRERTSTPRQSPVAPQASPATVQKPLVGTTSAPRAAWDNPSGWNAVNPHERDWCKTHTLG